MEGDDPSSQQMNSPPIRRHAITTLRHRDFRLLWCGLLVSTIGQQIQSVVLPWHVYVLTDSPLQVGLVSLFGAVPFIALSFIGGAVADRLDRKRILLITQTITMLLTGALVVTTATGVVTPWLIYAVRFFAGATTAFDNPVRVALIPNVVPREELSNAFALQSLLRQTGAIIGPSIGGLLIGQFGLSATYAVNAASFLITVVVVLLMGSVPMTRSETARGWEMVLGGLRYVRGQPLILSMLALDFFVIGLGSFRAMLPFFADDILAVGPKGLGLLHAAPGVGAAVGAVVLGSIGGVRRPITAVLIASVGYGACVLGFSLSTFFPLSLLLLFGTGITDVVGEVQRATIIQSIIPDDVRGRVTGVHQVFSFGGFQLGQVWSGGVASIVGPVLAVLLGGCGVLLAVGAFATLSPLRQGQGLAVAQATVIGSGHSQ